MLFKAATKICIHKNSQTIKHNSGYNSFFLIVTSFGFVRSRRARPLGRRRGAARIILNRSCSSRVRGHGVASSVSG